MDSDTVVKSEPVEQSNAVRSHKGHSRSKSQTLISFAGPTNDELMKHFERSLEPKIVVPNHAKSKSLPRPMRDRNFPTSFFIESQLIRAASSNDSLRQSNDSLNLDKKNTSGPIRTFRQSKTKQQTRNRSKGRGKQNQISFQQVKNEPSSPSNNFKVSSPSSTYSSSVGSPQMQNPSMQQSSMGPTAPTPPVMGVSHSRSRSAPVQPVIPKRTNTLASGQRQRDGGINPPGLPMSGRPMTNVEIELDRIPLPSNWEMATSSNGHHYYVDHSRQTTTNEDPRLTIRQELLQKHADMCEKAVSNLPSNCEKRVTPDGNIFFINHTTKQTHWLHPLIEKELLPNTSQSDLKKEMAMDVESGGDTSTSFGEDGAYDDLRNLEDVLAPSPSQSSAFRGFNTSNEQMNASNMMQRLAQDGNSVDGSSWGIGNANHCRMTQSPLASQGQPQQQQQPPSAQSDYQTFAAQHGYNFDRFQSHSSHSLPPNFRNHNQQPLVMGGGGLTQNTPQRPIQHPFHQRSRSHHLSSSQNFNHNPLPNRLQPNLSSRQNSFPGRMNDLRNALENYPMSNSSSSGMNNDISDPLNFIQELDPSAFGNDLTDDLMNQLLHSIQSN